MSSRRKGRELAIQFLYQWENNPEKDLARALKNFWAMAEADEPTRRNTSGLAEGVITHLSDIDSRIQSLASNWQLERIASVDRNILRLAIFEMLHRDDIPPVVSINEAIEIAKRFSTEESGKFVNGILDKLRKDIPRPSRHASGE